MYVIEDMKKVTQMDGRVNILESDVTQISASMDPDEPPRF